MSPTSPLLKIDAGAAARKLSEKRFRSGTETIVALIRLAASFAPERIHVFISRGKVEIVSHGGEPDGSVFRYAALLFDPTASEALRMEALSSLENRSGASFLAAFSEKFSSVRAQWQENGRARGIDFVQNERPKSVALNLQESLRITVMGKMGAVSRVPTVARYCRFSTIPIYINQVRVNRGQILSGCLVQHSFESEKLRGVVGIPREGVLSCLIRLENGIVIEETFYGERRGLIMDAVLDNPHHDADGKDLLEALRDKGRLLYRDLASRYSSIESADRFCAQERLMSRYEHSFDRYLVAENSFFSTVTGQTVDLFEIKRRAAREKVFALDKDMPVHHYRTRKRFVLSLDARGKKFLHLCLGLTPESPPRHVTIGSGGFVVRKFLSFVFDRLKPRGIRIKAESLNEAECRFLEVLQAQLADKDRIFFTNARMLTPIEQTAAGRRIRIPRRHPMMQILHDTLEQKPAAAAWVLCYLTRGALPEPHSTEDARP